MLPLQRTAFESSKLTEVSTKRNRALCEVPT